MVWFITYQVSCGGGLSGHGHGVVQILYDMWLLYVKNGDGQYLGHLLALGVYIHNDVIRCLYLIIKVNSYIYLSCQVNRL